MTRKTLYAALGLSVLAGATVLLAQYNPGSNYNEPGGVRTVIQGSLDVASGGDLDIESGGSFKIAGTAVTSTAAELNILDGVTATAAELNKADGVASTAYLEVCDGISFTEASAANAYTGTVEIPAGAWVTEVLFTSTVLWDGTSASLSIGDDDDSDGWFDNVNLKATDLLVGEVLSLDDNNWGGKQGVYLTTAGRRGRINAGESGGYVGAATEVIGVVTPGAADGTAGRSFLMVCYAVPTFTASTNT